MNAAGLTMFAVAMVILTIGEVIMWPAFLTLANELAPKGKAGFYQGLVNSIATIGKMVEPVFGGFIVDFYNIEALFFVIVGLLIIPFITIKIYDRNVQLKTEQTEARRSIMTDIKLIALDMDGTLLNDAQEVPEANRLAIEKALAKDVHVILSTGRGIDHCYSYAVDLKLPSYIVSANGAEIWTMEKELLQRKPIRLEMIEKLYNLARQVGVEIWMISTAGAFREKEIPRDFENYDWLKFGCSTEDQKKLDILVKEFSVYEELELANSLPTNIEVNAKGVSKAGALRYLCDKIGITMENVLACGDSLNDIKMIQEAGAGVAMGNAQEAIKKAADYITVSNNEAGVAAAIEKYVLHA